MLYQDDTRNDLMKAIRNGIQFRFKKKLKYTSKFRIVTVAQHINFNDNDCLALCVLVCVHLREFSMLCTGVAAVL